MGARPLAEDSDETLGAPVRFGGPPSLLEGTGWIALGLLFAALLVGALTFTRAGRPSLVGDEATYAMQAASLAWDHDLAYTRADYDRFVAAWGGPPDGVILQSRDGGRHITYGKPFLYAALVAPFSRLSPIRGPLVANVLMLAMAAWLTTRTLRRSLGEVAPLWVAVLVFGGVGFAYAFWIHADVLLFAATAAGYALAFGGAPPLANPGPLPQLYPRAVGRTTGRFVLRWAAAGALVAIPIAFRPSYGLLLLPLMLAVPRGRRWAGVSALLAGAVLVLVLTAFGQWASGGDWSGYAGERRGFYANTGYPDVDFPPASWEAVLHRWGNSSWVQEGAFEPYWSAKLWGWDAVYFLVGRDVGVLPYFLPLVLGFLVARREHGRWLIPVVVILAALSFFVVRPFNFYGGGGAIANRYFLPLYPALWFMAGRRGKPSLPLLVALCATPFMTLLWRHPSAFPIGENGRYSYVSPIAQYLLPYETTQSHIPGGSDASAEGLWIKLLNDNVVRLKDGSYQVKGTGAAEILVGSPDPLTGVALDFDREAPSRLRVGTAELRPTLLRSDGSISFDIALGRPRAVHPMWWTHDDFYLYEVRFELVGGGDHDYGLAISRERHLAPRRIADHPARTVAAPG